MWFNGFMVVIDMALESLGRPDFSRQRDALVLGAFREDVCYLPVVQLVYQSPSLTHFYRRHRPGGFIPYVYPGPMQRTQKFFARAVAQYQRGRYASAFVQLGRAIHPLIDMSCPVHAQGVAHATDPLEWCVEAMHDELRELPVDHVSDANSAGEIVEHMALFAQNFAADKTNNPWGRLLRRWGWRNPVSAALARAQARILIPRAAGCTAALLRLFAARIEAQPLDAAHTTDTAATLRHLQMSPSGCRMWFARLDRFCERHGRERHYQELTRLVAKWRAALEPPQTGMKRCAPY